MIIFCLGTKASGSTWVFNIVRSIAAYSGRQSISFYSDDVDAFIGNFEVVDGFIVVKCHFMDQRLLDLARLLNAKIIVSSRDPRDCAVSLSERFKFDIIKVIQDLSHSYASILAIPSDIKLLKLRYEVDLLFDTSTIRKIADFIGCDLSESVIENIYSEFSHAAVAERVSKIIYSGDPIKYFEPSTHWHVNHVGDAQSGKWQDRLDPLHARAIEVAILPMDLAGDMLGMTVFWPTAGFSSVSACDATDKMVVSCDGTDHGLVWGPYWHLPSGRWTAEYLIEPRDGDLTIKIDVHEPVPSRGLLALRTIELQRHNSNDFRIEFDHLDQSHPVEARMSSISDDRKGSFMFAGVKLTRSGPSPQRNLNSANHISPCSVRGGN